MKKTFRVLLAMAVLAGGTGLALLFRLEQEADLPSTLGETAPTVSQMEDAVAAPVQTTSGRTHPPEDASAGVTRPPDSEAHPDPERRSVARGDLTRESGASSGVRGDDRDGGIAAPGPPQRPRTHKIVDGDTLQEIARRYLGSASLAGAIFEANRVNLSDPALLPIGMELTIPPENSLSVTPTDTPIRQPLVPVADGDR